MQLDNSMLEIVVSKLSSQPAYIAWYLHQYAGEEKITIENVRDKLQLSVEQFGRLAMCKAPNSRAKDFVGRIKTIQEFTGVNYFLLITIIRKGDALLALKNANVDSLLLAARKQDDLQDEKEEKES